MFGAVFVSECREGFVYRESIDYAGTKAVCLSLCAQLVELCGQRIFYGVEKSESARSYFADSVADRRQGRKRIQTVEEGMTGTILEGCQGVTLLQKGHKVLKDFVYAVIGRRTVGDHVFCMAGGEQQGVKAMEKQGITAIVGVVMTIIR